MKKLLILIAILLPTTVFAAFPPCDSAGKPWREGNKTYYCSGVGGAWLEVDTDDHENVIRYGARCDSSTDSSTAFIAANVAATTSGKRVYIPSCPNGQDYLVDENVTFTNPVELASDALLNIQAGDTVTFSNKSFVAPKEKIFIGNVSFGTQQEVYPQWWGAIGDGNDINAAANVTAFQQAINSLTSGNVIVDGSFSVVAAVPGNNDILTPKDNVNLKGLNPSRSIIKIADSGGQYRSILGDASTTHDNVKVNNITFDHNAANNTFATLPEYQSPQRATVSYYGDNSEFKNNIVKNSDSVVNVNYNGTPNTHVVVKDNKFLEMGYPKTDFALNHDTSAIYVYSDVSAEVSGNYLIGTESATSARTAIETHSTNTVVSNNVIKNYSKGMNITGIAAEDSEAINVSDNSVDVYLQGMDIWSTDDLSNTGYGIDTINISDNTIKVNYTEWTFVDPDLTVLGIRVNPATDLDTRNIIISDNTLHFSQEAEAYSNTLNNASIGIGIWGSSKTHTAENTVIKNNVIVNFPVAAIRLAGVNVTLGDAIIEGNELINPGQSLTVNPLKSAFFIDVGNITGQLDITRNKVIDNFAVTRLDYAYELYNTALNPTPGTVNITYNEIDIQGDAVAWNRPLLQNAPENNPYYVEDTIWTRVPLVACKKGSTIRDVSNNVEYFLLADGTSWISWEYGVITISSSVATLSSGSSFDAGAGSFELPNGTTIPATCNVGEQFIDTDSNDCIDTGAGDGALCVCKTANTWALISDF